MKNLIFIIFSLLLLSCTSSKKSYWCGDHPCINKAERKAYFKKNMIVEVKMLNKKDKKEISRIEKITRQARVNEKKRIKNEKELAKQARLDEKERIKNEKELIKQARLDEKKRIKNEKELAKQVRLDEKKQIKEQKKLVKQARKDKKKKGTNKVKKFGGDKKIVSQDKIEVETGIVNIEVSSSDFKKLSEKIIKKNMIKPYPDINRLPK